MSELKNCILSAQNFDETVKFNNSSLSIIEYEWATVGKVKIAHPTLLDFQHNRKFNHPILAGICRNSFINKIAPPVITQNFTAAHELGHAVLHKQTVMHRDRPVDGSYNNKKRSLPELQADRFATHFLMPKKIVIEIFQELFQTDRFIIKEDSAFHLIKGPQKS